MSQRMQERRGQYFGKAMRSVPARQVCPPGKEVSLKDFEILKVLGEGSFGKVFLVRKIGGVDNGKLYALKQLQKDHILQNQKRVEYSRTERQVLETVRKCPFLATLHYAFQTNWTINLVLDFIKGGDMYTHSYRKQQFTEAELRVYLGEIVLALETLHTSGIIYRDLKPENVMLDSDGHIVLTDFGLCKQFQVSDVIQRAYSFCGTPDYIAPEMEMRGESGYDFTVDWWSLGVMTFEMLTGRYPFRSEPNYPGNISPEMKNLLQGLLTKDPANRLGSRGVQDIKQHPFFKSLNWEDLGNKKIPVPFVPKIDHELDLSNFSEEFTKMTINEPSVIVPLNPGKLHFSNYAYVAPSLILTDKLTEVNISAKAKKCRRRKKSRAVRIEKTDCKNSIDLSPISNMGVATASSIISAPQPVEISSNLWPPIPPSVCAVHGFLPHSHISSTTARTSVIMGGQQSNNYYNCSLVSPEDLPFIVEDNGNNRHSKIILTSPITRGLKRKGTVLKKFDDKLGRKV